MTRERHLHPSWCVLAALALPLGAEAQFRRGNEFQVNTYTTRDQRNPSVAIEADGDFVVAWQSGQSYQGQDGSVTGVFARRFSSAGASLAGEFQVNTFTDQGQDYPSVAASATGDFVVVWRSRQDTSDYAIFARRFSSTGTPLAIEFQVNTYTLNGQRFPSVAASASGDFVVVWHTFPNQDGSGYGVSAQRFSSAGGFLATEFQVNTYTPDYQRYPSVAASASGNFVVSWQSKHQDGSSYGVFAQLFSSAGAPLTGEFQVNTYTMDSQRYVSVAADADGDFVVAWQSYQDGSNTGIFARRFSSAGSPLATEFQVNTYSTGTQRSPSVAAGADGDFVVAWRSYPQDGEGYGVFAQRFAASLALDIDGNGLTQPLSDGLLVLRRFFGFTGATLTTGAVGGGCMRCDAAAIEPYIAGLGLVLDIDGNTMKEPLTDGLLALRFLFGFTGSTLTTSAVGQGCTRCDAAMIVPYLNALTM